MKQERICQLLFAILGTGMVEYGIYYQETKGEGNQLCVLFELLVGFALSESENRIALYLLMQAPMLLLLFFIVSVVAYDEGKIQLREVIVSPSLYILAIYVAILLVPNGLSFA